MKHADRITFDPEQCGGRPCIRHYRIQVKDVLEWLEPLLPLVDSKLEQGERLLEVR